MASRASDVYFYTLKDMLDTEFGEDSLAPVSNEINNNVVDPSSIAIQDQNKRTILDNPYLSDFLGTLKTENRMKPSWFSKEKVAKSCNPRSVG